MKSANSPFSRSRSVDDDDVHVDNFDRKGNHDNGDIASIVTVSSLASIGTQRTFRVYTEKSNQRGKDHVQLVFLFDWFGFGCMAKYKQNQIYLFDQIQTSQTGRPAVHDPSPKAT